MVHIKLHMPAGFHAFVIKYCLCVRTLYTSYDFLLLTSTRTSKYIKGCYIFKRCFFKNIQHALNRKNAVLALLLNIRNYY